MLRKPSSVTFFCGSGFFSFPILHCVILVPIASGELQYGCLGEAYPASQTSFPKPLFLPQSFCFYGWKTLLSHVKLSSLLEGPDYFYSFWTTRCRFHSMKLPLGFLFINVISRIIIFLVGSGVLVCIFIFPLLETEVADRLYITDK